MPTYKQLVDLSKPVSYWRLGEGTLDMTTQTMADVLDGTYYTWHSSDLNQSVITINGTGATWSYTHGTTGYDNDLSDCQYYYDGDFDISFDFSNAVFTNLNAGGSYIGLLISVKIDETDLFNVQFQQTNTGARSFYCNAPGTSDTHTAVNDFGSMRITRVGSTITAYVKDGVEAWDQRMTYTSSGTCTPYFYMQGSGDADANLTVDVDNLSASGTAKALWVFDDGPENRRLWHVDAPDSGATAVVPTSIDNAVTYDGVSQYSYYNVAAYRSTDTQGSIEAWIKLDSSSGVDDYYFAISDTSATSVFLGPYIADDLKLGFYYRSAPATNTVFETTSFQVEVGVVYHIVITSDGSTYRLYVNGTQQSITFSSGSNHGNWLADFTGDPSDNITIGAYSAITTAGHVPGTIDEVAYYDRPLSAAEVEAHYAVGLSESLYVQDTIKKGAVHYWRLGEDTGSSARDLVGGFTLTHFNTTLGVDGLLSTDDDLAVDFNGTTSHLREDLPASCKTANVTVEAWIKVAQGTNTQNYMIAGGVPSRSGADGRGFYMVIDTNGNLRANVGKIGTAAFAFALGTTDLRDDKIHHVVSTYDGTTIRVYLDGVEEDNTVDAAGIEWTDGSGDPTPGQFYIGANRDNTPTGDEPNRDYMDGVIDEVAWYDYAMSQADIRNRYALGQYKEDYPTTVLRDYPTHYWRMDDLGFNLKNAVLMLPFDGANGSTYFDELAQGLTATASGDVQLSTVQKKVGRSSAYFDGSLDRITFPDSADWELGGVDFTIDAWVYPTSYQAWRTIVAHHAGSIGWRLLLGDSGQLHFSTDNGVNNGFFTANGVVPLNTWTHVACVGFSDGTNKAYINGKLAATKTGMAITNTFGGTLKVGTTDGSAWFWEGYIDDLRIIKGRADYTEDFTPRKYPQSINTINNGYFTGNTSNSWLTRGGTINYISGSMEVARSGAGYDAHGAYQEFSTIPGQAYRVYCNVTTATHYSELNIYSDTSFSNRLGVDSFTTNGQTGQLKAYFIAEKETSVILARVANSTTAISRYDNFYLRPALFDAIDDLSLEHVSPARIGGLEPGLVPSLSDSYSTKFDGTTDFCRAEIANWRDTDGVGSMEAWIQMTGLNPEGDIILGSADAGSTTFYGLFYVAADGKLRWTVSTTSGTQTEVIESTIGGLNDGEVHHVVVTSDGSTTRLYYDGKEVPTTVISGASGNTGIWLDDCPSRDNVSIGGFTYAAGDFSRFNGWIDEVAYYDYTLSAATIQKHYDVGISNGYERVIRQAAPVHWWKLDETSGTIAVDSMGSEDLTYTNNPSLGSDSLVLGDTGQAVTFDGTDDYVRKDTTTFRTTDTLGSIEAWIRTNDNGSPQNIWAYTKDTGAERLYLMIVNGGKIRVANFSSGVDNYVETPSGSIQSGVTHHVVATSDGSSYYIYIDGVLQPLTLVGGSNNGLWINDITPGGMDLLTIGREKNAAGFFYEFDGQIDEVAYYNYQLTSNDVHDHYVAGTVSETNVSGNALTYNGNPIDRVTFFEWNTKKYCKTFTPDNNGDWEGLLPAGEYGVVYEAEGCKPITHGPYTVN